MEYTTKDLNTKIQKLCEDIVNCHDESYPNLAGSFSVTARKGQKFIKIIKEGEYQNSVWGFINLSHPDFKFGDVLMAKSWKGPALNKARGNILEQDYVIKGMRQYGPDYLV
jgi:hypothetical protein